MKSDTTLKEPHAYNLAQLKENIVLKTVSSIFSHINLILQAKTFYQAKMQDLFKYCAFLLLKMICVGGFDWD